MCAVLIRQCQTLQIYSPLGLVIWGLVIGGLAKDEASGTKSHADKTQLFIPTPQLECIGGLTSRQHWVYTEKECLTISEFQVLQEVGLHLKSLALGITPYGTFQDCLPTLRAQSLVVFAFFPTPQLMRGSGDAWLLDLSEHAQEMGQALTLVAVHSKQFLQRLQLSPAVMLEKGIMTDPPFPVAEAHRFEQEFYKSHGAHLYRKAGKCSKKKDMCGIGTVTFQNKLALEVSTSLPTLLGHAATQIAFFGEGAGLGMLSVSALAGSDVQIVKAKLQNLNNKLQSQRVSPTTATMPWSEVMSQLGCQGSSQSHQKHCQLSEDAEGNGSDFMPKFAEKSEEPCAKRAKLCR